MHARQFVRQLVKAGATPQQLCEIAGMLVGTINVFSENKPDNVLDAIVAYSKYYEALLKQHGIMT